MVLDSGKRRPELPGAHESLNLVGSSSNGFAQSLEVLEVHILLDVPFSEKWYSHSKTQLAFHGSLFDDLSPQQLIEQRMGILRPHVSHCEGINNLSY